MTTHSPGKLYLVSTPIGNLKDITLRALEVLAAVDLIAAEDTRHAAILLKNYNIKTPTTSFFDFNKEQKAPLLLRRLQQGESIAVIADAGTPGISDEAYYIVSEALRANIPVEAIPGATALIPALITSGLPTDRFVFEGFLPVKKGRQKRLQQLADENRTIIIYESPKRLFRTLQDLLLAWGDRRIAIARELTKKFEQIYRGRLTEICEQPDRIVLKGELVIVVEGKA
ncbi:MAG: 16S rRNA (cytidine(1402)-2'-O)-methyltransferase [candidate division KSB1 bacterium]|nr:16S rRNA (cytidine(1402)-2'-O)-methyltransferase [candidate division KSB1 bacterium]